MAPRKLATNSDSDKRAYGYCRVSTTGQGESGLGLAEQERKIRARAAENDWTLEQVFVDVISGSTPLAKRPQGARMLAQAKPGDVVIGAKLDRLFRSAADCLATIETLKRRRVDLLCLDVGSCTSGGVGELLVTIMSAVAQFERARMAERVADAKAQLRAQGRHQGGDRPFGWRFGEATGTGRSRDLIPDPAEQGAIATMRRMRAKGSSLMAIRDTLRAKGFGVSHETVRGILARSEDAAAAA